MTTEAVDTIAKPHITPTQRTATFWESANRGLLLLQRCGACGRYQHYPRAMCAACWSTDLTWQPSRGVGAVWTFTVVAMPGHPAWAADVPYVLALVALDEGPCVMTNIVNCGSEEVHVGQRVQISPTWQADTQQTILTFTLCNSDE